MAWQEIINSAGNFAMSGVYLNDKLYLGGYGNGNIYSFLPLATELSESGEAILSMCVFNGNVYCTTENNDMAGQRTRILRRLDTGIWVESGLLAGYASYFMCVLNNVLLVTATTNLTSIDYWYSTDGVNFTKHTTFSDWLWVPAVFNNELYLLGHTGPPGGPGDPKAVKWNGSAFVDVVPLCGTSGVTEWQCAVEHKGYMYLGAGSWTLGGTSTAAVYKFDGTTVSLVKSDANFHECQCLYSSATYGYLYASFGHGFKSDVGGSKIYASLDGVNNWIESGAFPACPQMYVIVESIYGFICAGGSQGNLRAYYYNTGSVNPLPQPPNPDPLPPPNPSPNPTPTPVPTPGCTGFTNFFGVKCPRCSAADVFALSIGLMQVVSFKCNQCHTVFDAAGLEIGA